MHPVHPVASNPKRALKPDLQVWPRLYVLYSTGSRIIRLHARPAKCFEHTESILASRRLLMAASWRLHLKVLRATLARAGLSDGMVNSTLLPGRLRQRDLLKGGASMSSH